jgi:ribosome-associated toxin RatA of RatAB toxin-antitoxin module
MEWLRRGGVALSSVRSVRELMMEHPCGGVLSRVMMSEDHGTLVSNRRHYGSIHHKEKKLIVGPTREQMYEVITNVKDYQAFVPYIQKSTVLSEVGKDPKTYMEAEVELGFQVFLERYLSKIHMDFPKEVVTRTDDSTLFSHLNSCWKLHPGPTPASVWVDFEVDFAFKSALYSQVATIFLEEVVKKMMGAFEQRCRDVYKLS